MRLCPFYKPYITTMSLNPQTQIRIAIVGGGIGGLALAYGLSKKPHLDIHIYEGASEYNDVGFGLALHLNAIRAMMLIGPEVAVARGELDDRPPVRDHVDEDPLRSLGAGMGKSGIKELDEQSGEAQRFSQFLESMTPQGKASPPPGFPGVADALRSD